VRAVATAVASSGTTTSTAPVTACMGAGPMSCTACTPSPPPSIMAGPPMPILLSLVAMITSHIPSSAALPAKLGPATTPTRGTSR
jgi:hypothetical protein